MNKVKYLSIILDKNLKFDSQVKYICIVIDIYKTAVFINTPWAIP